MIGIYDTPGYGDKMNNRDSFDRIKDDLNKRHKDWLERRNQDDPDVTYSMKKDERIHLCLYFMYPHRMKELDYRFMEHLSSIVNIVPIVAKADTMTIDEKNRFLTKVKLNIRGIREKLRKDSTDPEFDVVFEFEDDWTEEEYDSRREIERMENDRIAEITEDTTTTEHIEGTKNLGYFQHLHKFELSR